MKFIFEHHVGLGEGTRGIALADGHVQQYIAAQALVGPGGEIATPEVLAAAGGALLISPLRSLPACLVGGLVAWVLAGFFV